MARYRFSQVRDIEIIIGRIPKYLRGLTTKPNLQAESSRNQIFVDCAVIHILNLAGSTFAVPSIFRLQWLPYKSCQSKKKEIITPPYIYMGSTETSKASVLSHSILVESYLLFFLSDHKMVTKPSFGLSVWIIIQVRIILFQKTFHIFLIFISNKWTWTKSTNIVFF